MAHDMTVDMLSKALPKSLKSSANQKWVDKINGLTTDPIVREAYRENLLSYTNVIEKGRFQIGHYIDAVKYITHKLMGDPNIVAYTKTFPDRYQEFVNKGTSKKDIASYVTSYNKNKLVNLVREQTMIPTWILNSDLYQSAINTQAQIMTDLDVNARDRTAAANSLLQHLKAPEVAKVELDVKLGTESIISDLRKATQKLAAQQRDNVIAGLSTPKEIAEAPIKIIEGELDD